MKPTTESEVLILLVFFATVPASLVTDRASPCTRYADIATSHESNCDLSNQLCRIRFLKVLEGDFSNDAGRSVVTSQDDNIGNNELFNQAYQKWIQVQKSKNHEKKYVTERYAQKYKKAEMSRLLKENDGMSSKEAKAMVEKEFNQNYFIM